MKAKIGGRAERKADSRRRFLASAAELFRRDGYSATGVDAVMARAGLTAGGFYNHFRSKEELLGACLEAAYGQSWERLTRGLSGSRRARAQAIFRRYLSRVHRDDEIEPCPLVSLSAELGRHSRHVARLTARHLERLLGELEKLGLSRARAAAELSRAVGALLIARVLKGEKLGDEFLLGG